MSAPADSTSISSTSTPVALPRVAITFCTQCRWMLRAAYFAQELLSTFGTQIGEVALVPGIGGVFRVELVLTSPDEAASLVRGDQSGAAMSTTRTTTTSSTTAAPSLKIEKVLLWDYKTERGFPETKVLKQRVRDHIDPKKDLGHSDVGGKKGREERERQRRQDGGTGQEKAQKVVVAEAGQAGRGQHGAGVGDEVERNADGRVCEDCT